MGSDTIWIFSIIGILMMMGLLLPFMDEVLVLDEAANMRYNASEFIPDAQDTQLVNETAEQAFTATPKVNMVNIMSGIGTAFFWSWSWMWQSSVGAIFGTIHILMRFMLILLIYRQARSGAG